MLADGVVDGKDAAHGGAHGAAVAAEGVDVLEPDALLGKGVEDGLTAVVKLVRGGVKAGELVCGVGDVQTEERLGAVEDGHLGGGGAGGEREDLVSHGFLSDGVRDAVRHLGEKR